ncbi:ROK family transcriptional regulator [Streptomyces indicus]|uniref:Sugar kinase of the NBD/HSP70 family, may contain an N-terminal HTH domain n=1 Tax=Streptomyces indicus TaxID=417292 RepID=A0A1G9GJZ5_9ACTN|nr:ROK family protein [Streptomyces indicus]SDL01008.1 Sugar kinase of the NBD/HSP70 family, may contain an N-terminal HTH domain [Streptomyces indicus]
MKADLRGAGVRDLGGDGPPRAGDRASLRRTNLGLVLRLLRDAGPRPRTQIAADTGLPKATITNLVAELVELGLVREGDAARDGGVGRPSRTLELDGRTVCGIGLEISADYLGLIALDLGGEVVAEHRAALDVRAEGADAVLDRAAATIRTVRRTLKARGTRLVAITVAAPGVIQRDSGVVSYAPNIDWRDVDVLGGLRARLGRICPPLQLENDAKLGAIAEYLVASAADIQDLIYVTGETGVGGGIISDGRLLRGSAGFAGEIGHMRLQPDGERCACGRRGCFETLVGLNALLDHAAAPDDPVRDATVDLEERLAELKRRADAGDPATRAALDTITEDLGLGLAALADILNPRAIVLGGYFAFFGEYLVDRVQLELSARVMAPDAGGCTVLASTLGFSAAARGGASLSLDHVYRDPAGVLSAAGR